MISSHAKNSICNLQQAQLTIYISLPSVQETEQVISQASQFHPLEFSTTILSKTEKPFGFRKTLNLSFLKRSLFQSEVLATPSGPFWDTNSAPVIFLWFYLTEKTLGMAKTLLQETSCTLLIWTKDSMSSLFDKQKPTQPPFLDVYSSPSRLILQLRLDHSTPKTD